MIKLLLSYQLPRASITTDIVKLRFSVEYENAKLVDVALDPSSLNRYFRDDSVSMLESLALVFSKAVSDSYTLSEEHSFSLQKAETDGVSVTESLSKEVDYRRGFTDQASVTEVSSFSFDMAEADQASVSDAQAFLVEKPASDSTSISEAIEAQFGKSLTDAVSATEALSYSFSTSFSESASVQDSPAIGTTLPQSDGISVSEVYSPEYGKGLSETLSMSESLSRVVQFNRTFSDAFVLDDLAQIGDFAKQAVLDKENVATLSEDLSYAASKAVADTLSMQESLAKAFATSFAETTGFSDSDVMEFGKSNSDSVTMSEVASVINTEYRGKSIFNTGAINAFAFNE